MEILNKYKRIRTIHLRMNLRRYSTINSAEINRSYMKKKTYYLHVTGVIQQYNTLILHMNVVRKYLSRQSTAKIIDFKLFMSKRKLNTRSVETSFMQRVI